MSIPKHEYLSGVWKDGIFSNKVVFCTGGSGSICSVQVRALVHLGANACIVGRNPEKTERVAKSIQTAREGSKVIGIGSVDVRKFEQLKDAVQRCVDELGSLDFLIAGAAGNFLAPITQLSPNAFKAVIDIDVLGSYNATKAALPHLLTSAAKHNLSTRAPSSLETGGRILFVSATLHYTGVPLQSHAAVAKAGIDSLSNALAIELGPRGITSNVVAPGPIDDTEGLARLVKGSAHEESRKRVPVGRYGKTKEIADATVYLFSDSGNFVNGETLVVDGGTWRISNSIAGAGFEYPDFLLSDTAVSDVLGTKSSKL